MINWHADLIENISPKEEYNEQYVQPSTPKSITISSPHSPPPLWWWFMVDESGQYSQKRVALQFVRKSKSD